MRRFEITGLNRQILDAVRELYPNAYQAGIARRLKITTQRLNPHVRRLVAEHYLKVTAKDVFQVLELDEQGIKVMARNTGETFTPSPFQTNTRAESYRLKYPLKDKLWANAPAMVVRIGGFEPKLQNLKNSERTTFYVEGVTAVLNTASLELYAPHIYATSKDPSIAIEDREKRILDPIALKVEAAFNKQVNFRLQRDTQGNLISERLEVELEEEEHPLAEAKPKDYKLEVHHPQDNKLRAKIEYSRGRDRPELSMQHRLTAPADRDVINAQFNALFDGEVNLLDLPELKKIVVALAQSVNRQSQGIEDLQALIKRMLEEMKL